MNNQAEFYDWFAAAYEFLYKVIDAERTVQQWNSLLQTVLPTEKSNSRLRLLDVGCGPGWHLPHWHRRDFIVSGLDVSTAMLKFAKAEWAKEVGEEAPPLYRADLLDLTCPILAAPPFDILALHTNVLHLFSPDTLPSLFGALGRLAAPGALMIADFTNTTLLTGSSREAIDIHGIPWGHISRFDRIQGVLEQMWTDGTGSMTELSWPIEPAHHDIIAAEAGWILQSRVGWNPQDFEAPFRNEWANQTRCVTIYARAAAKRSLEDRAGGACAF